MKLLETAEIKDIQSLISNDNELNIRVNFYQRPYKWTAKKINELFEDYKENRESGKSSQEYFIGAVVLVDERNLKERDSGEVWKYQVVDGQQRFTTLFLFNYIKYMLLIRKVDIAAKTNRSTDFIEGLKSMEKCYKGYIGSNKWKEIAKANHIISNAFDEANRKREPISDYDLNIWRESVGWIRNPDISASNYYDKCKKAMVDFLDGEYIKIHYENQYFNQLLKEALAQIVFKFSDTSDVVFCEEAMEYYDYDENEETVIECPYVLRAYGIFEQIKLMYMELNKLSVSTYDKLIGYIQCIDEMLKNIKMCMIVTSDEDDAYKLFETLNDRSESVNNLELLKNDFFKTYVKTSGDAPEIINKNISNLDDEWRKIFFYYEDLKPEIFEYMTVWFTGNTDKNTSEKKRKLIKAYLEKYSENYRYSYERIKKDFEYMKYIQNLLCKIHRLNDSREINYKEDSQLSLYIENDISSSMVKRALGIAMNIPYPNVVAAIICDIIHNFASNTFLNDYNYDMYINDVFNENTCRHKYPGLWNDACIMWKVIILSQNYESPKKFSNKLVQKCNINKVNTIRQFEQHIIQFNSSEIDEDKMMEEFEGWIEEWKFSDNKGKIKIKNLFMHMFLKYDRNPETGKLILNQTIGRCYTSDAIKQDLDHMDAKRVNRQNDNEKKYFHYNFSDRTDYINSLGNMMPLPVKINRGKHNTPMYKTIESYSRENLNGWIFDMAKEDFDNYHIIEEGYKKPTEQFFNNRKDCLIDYFKRIVKNQKFMPDNNI